MDSVYCTTAESIVSDVSVLETLFFGEGYLSLFHMLDYLLCAVTEVHSICWMESPVVMQRILVAHLLLGYGSGGTGVECRDL